MNNVPVDNTSINSMPIDGVSLSSMPVTVVAQFGEVTVYQTSAATDDDQLQQVRQTSYGTLNLGLHVNDDAEQVLQNRMRLLSAINTQLSHELATDVSATPIKRLHWVNQIHGNQIHNIDATTLAIQPINADAMITQQPNIGLAIMTADCVPIVLYQPTTGQIAAIHAGWQGLACGVIRATASRFDRTAPIKAWIGVCISQAHYEVNRDVSGRLLAGCIDKQLLTSDDISNFESLFCMVVDTDVNTDITTETSTDKLKLDLPKIAIAQLQSLNITVANELPVDCSYADSRYYSYRRQTHKQQLATGRMALIIVRSDPIKNKVC